MGWIETIKVQSGAGKENAIEKALISLAREIQETTDPHRLSTTSVCRNTSAPGCFALWLFWNTEEPGIRGTALGLSVAQSLKVFGLIDHSIWIECSETEGGDDHRRHNKKA